MRHAKSGYPEGVADHDRPLAKRGIREAGLAGDWLRSNIGPIDAVLCSSAARTRETLTRSGIAAPARYLDQLYGATPATMIGEISGVGDEVTTLLVVGHEPTISRVALALAARPGSDDEALERIAMKFPTSGLAVLRVSGGWADVTLSRAELVSFHIPR